MAHSIISPSSAYRWTRCTGAPRLCAGRGIDRPSEASEEGTLAHEAFAAILRGQPTPDVPDDMLGYVLDAAMAIHTQDAEDILHVEAATDLSVIAPECCGTPDVWAYDRGDILRVWDLKYGWGPVEAEGNYQLVAYAAGILSTLGKLKDDSVTLSLTILQPRPYHRKGPWRTWVIKTPELRQYLHTLQRQAEVALRGNPTYQTGAHCSGCAAAHACPAFGEVAGVMIDRAATPDLPPGAPVEDMARELSALDSALEILKFRRAALAGCVTDALQSGSPVPGWNLERSPGRLGWGVPDAEVLAIGLACGVDLSKPGTITPAQAKKAGIPAEVLGQVTKRPETVNLKRVDMARMKEVFNNGKGKN